MGGVGLQEAFILCFLGLAFRFQRQMSRETPMQDKPRAMKLLYVIYAALTLITVSRNPSILHSPTLRKPSLRPRSIRSV